MGDTGALKVVATAGREVVMTRVVDAPRALVFDAWTGPGRLPHWMSEPEGWSMTSCEVDLRVGGGWRFAWRHSGGAETEMRGVYLEIAPPGRLVFATLPGGGWPETVNTLALSEDDGATAITLKILYPSRDARDAALEAGLTQAMSASLDRLAALLSTGDRWMERKASGDR